MINIDEYTRKIKYYYKLTKEKKIDSYMILAGFAGVLLGLVCGIDIINKIFAWFILFGVVIKLYDFSEEIERSIIPYDFNRLLPPPPSKD